jgi:hypothetical protein
LSQRVDVRECRHADKVKEMDAEMRQIDFGQRKKGFSNALHSDYLRLKAEKSRLTKSLR